MPLIFEHNWKEYTIKESERQQCEVWDRVMGYYRPVQDWNIGKKQEHQDRLRFKDHMEGNNDETTNQ